MYNVNRVWVATSKYSKLHNIYKVLLDQSEREKLKSILLNRGKLIEKIEDHKNLSEKEPKSLIDGEKYYLKNTNLEEKQGKTGVDFLFSKIINNFESLKDEKAFTFKMKKSEYDDKKERARFLFLELKIENETKILFMLINTREIVRKRTLLEWNTSPNKNSSIISVPHGVPIPEDITAIYDFSIKKLYVHKVYEFEKMLFLHEASKELAKEKLKGFIRKDFTLSTDEYTVEGIQDMKVQEKILLSVRNTKRIAEYDGGTSKFLIKDIERAVGKLQPNKKVKIDHKNKKVKVDEDSADTFVAIIHDSIVQRLISGEVNVI